jgi:hypothetical protein
MTTLLKCFACHEIRPLQEGANRCRCGRSRARWDGAVVELQGPGRVLVPEEDVETVDGVPWTAVPEQPLVVRRAVA